MKICIRLLTVAAGLLAVNVALAQAPAGSTGQCKDGTYTTAPKKQGACRGHKGIQTWFAADAAAPAASVPAARNGNPGPNPSPHPTPSPGPTPSPTHANKSAAMPMQQAAGGGAGMVWVNTSTKVYHCAGTKYYGKTKEGKYMSEADAKASGARPDHGNACNK